MMRAAVSRGWRMIRLGGVASKGYLTAFPGIQQHFHKRGIELDWLLYSSWDALVDAFVEGEVDLAWNGPLAYVKIKRRLEEPCTVVAMRDNDVDLVTHFITRPDSDVATPEDLPGKRFAFGSRGMVEAGLLAHHYLRELGITPEKDLALSTFYEERGPSAHPHERDVVERVLTGEYDSGAVCSTTLERMAEEGTMPHGGIRIIWSSPPYSHCCFTAQSRMDAALTEKITEAFVSMDYADPFGKTVLDAEHCKAFLPGITEGWETLEKAAEEQGLI